MPPGTPSLSRNLHRQWLLYAILSLSLALGGYALLAQALSPALALRWLALAALALVYLLRVLWRGLPLNHRPGEAQLLPGLGAGNHLTMLRGLLLAALAGFLLLPRPAEGWLAWAPGTLYLLAVLADVFDGYLARITNHATPLGERLDISLDGLGVLSAALLAVSYGQAPLWYLLVALARYLYLGGAWLRQRQNLPLYDLSPSVRRRGFAGLQMGLGAALLFPVFSPPGTHIVATLFSLPFLTGFLYDWLTASGALRPGRPVPAWQDHLRRNLPLALRLLAVMLLIFQAIESPGGIPALYLLGMAVAMLLVLGAAGRASAILGLLLLGFQQSLAPLAPAQLALLAIYTALLYLGTGPLSLWTPEDRLIYRRLGEAPRT